MVSSILAASAPQSFNVSANNILEQLTLSWEIPSKWEDNITSILLYKSFWWEWNVQWYNWQFYKISKHHKFGLVVLSFIFFLF